MFKQTTALKKIAALKKRLRIIQGGSSAGKTIAILLILIDMAQSANNLLISVVSETFPHLSRGSLRDFLNIMADHHYFEDSRWNKTDHIYTFETGSRIEFFSADQPGKVRGPRRDILFINEANNISYETYTQLAIRTKKIIFIDYNPVIEFWVHTDLKNTVDCDFIILTYQDNEALSQSIIDEIESRKGNKNFWSIYGLGELGVAEGKIYTDWAMVDDIPHEARLERYGLDFGYSNDPAACVAVYWYNGGFILDEVFYQKGMSNKDIADILKNKDQALVVADSAEPKSIDEITNYGILIQPANKGKDSVNQGIQYVQQQRISMTKRSLNLIKEYRNYLWEVDKDGKALNVPQDYQNHLLDALRYAMETYKPHDLELLDATVRANIARSNKWAI